MKSLLNISFTDNYKNHGKQKFWQEKYDHTRDDTRQIEQRKELYRRKKQEHANIEEINDDNVNRDFRQEEVEPGMYTHI